MFGVHVAGDELGALTHDFRQGGFAIPVNECYLDQINDAPSRVPCVVLFAPTRLELSCPLADQLTLQSPPLLIGQIGDSDLQHYSPSTPCHKRRPRKPLCPKTYTAVYHPSCFGSARRERTLA